MKILRQRWVVVAGALSFAMVAGAKPWWMRGVDPHQIDFLSPDAAFRASGRVDGNLIRVRWVIAEGYYLYRQTLDIKAESPDLVLSAPSFPPGITKTDPYLGTQQIFTQQVEGTAAFTRSDGGAHPLEIKLAYQGCAAAGLCYPLINKVIFVSADGPGMTDAQVASGTGATRDALGTTDAGTIVPQGTIGSSPANKVGAPPQRWERFAILGGGLAFFLAGLLLRKGRRLASPA